MDKERSQMFFDYLPASELINKLKMHPRDLVLRAMRKQVLLFYPVKSQKNLTYYPVTKVDTRLKVLWIVLRTFILLSIGLDNRTYYIGQIVQIRGIDNLNALGNNCLNETLIFSYCFDTDSVIFRQEILWNKFHPVLFSDVLVHIDDALKLRQILRDEQKELMEEKGSLDAEDEVQKPKSKQAQREEVFLAWLAGKDELKVSNMKKDDVWGELQKVDLRLFSVEPKNFFRDQNIITFKSGRKPS